MLHILFLESVENALFVVCTITRHDTFMLCSSHDHTICDTSTRKKSFPLAISENRLFCMDFERDFNRRFSLSWLPCLVNIAKATHAAVIIEFCIVIKISWNTIKIKSVHSAIKMSAQKSSQPSSLVMEHTKSMTYYKEEKHAKSEESTSAIECNK